MDNDVRIGIYCSLRFFVMVAGHSFVVIHNGMILTQYIFTKLALQILELIKKIALIVTGI